MPSLEKTLISARAQALIRGERQQRVSEVLFLRPVLVAAPREVQAVREAGQLRGAMVRSVHRPPASPRTPLRRAQFPVLQTTSRGHSECPASAMANFSRSWCSASIYVSASARHVPNLISGNVSRITQADKRKIN